MPAPRRRVLFVVANDWYFYWHRLALAQRIAAAGYDVHVATPDGRFRNAIAAAGVQHHIIAFDRQGLNPLRDLSTMRALVALYRDLRPDVVHHVAIKPILYGAIAAKLARVPCVVNAMPGTGYVFTSRQLLARIIRPCLKLAFRLLMNGANSRTTFENRDDHRQWLAWHVIRPERSTVILGVGVDTNDFPPSGEPPGPPLVILAARLLAYKGVGEFVAAARLLKRSTNARFALVGEGDAGNPATITPAQLEEWRREGVVETLGWHDDMAPVLAASHIVCLPSHGGEGVPRSLMEAASCARPIVTTDVPGCRDIVHDGDNGLLVPPKQVPPLAAALERLIADGDLRRQMGERGRARAVSEFSVDIVAAETLRIYDELLARGAAK